VDGGAARHVDPATVKQVKALTQTAIRPLDTATARYTQINSQAKK